MGKIALMILCGSLLAGCQSWWKRDPEVVITKVPVICGNAPEADQVVMQDTPVKVIKTGDVDWFAFTPDGFEALLLNVASLKVKADQEALKSRFYSDCVTRYNAGVGH